LLILMGNGSTTVETPHSEQNSSSGRKSFQHFSQRRSTGTTLTSLFSDVHLP
jgi:hypothetical protein